MKFVKKLWKKLGPNPLDQILKRAARNGHKTFLIPWNRGLGDIALGLYAMVYRIRERIPNAEIVFLTRRDLKEGFALLDNVNVLIGKSWKRGIPFDLKETLEELKVDRKKFDVILEKPDPTRWLKWQIGSLVPKLQWSNEWDEQWKKFGLSPESTYVGVHVQTETNYAYEKNWLVKKWTDLFEKLTKEHGVKVILFGFQQTHSFPIPGVVDLRGRTNLFEMLSIVKNRCRYLVVPDSGVLSIAYYINASFPLHVVSLWADSNQGILKQGVASPNPQLVHVPLMGRTEDISTIEVSDVIRAMKLDG